MSLIHSLPVLARLSLVAFVAACSASATDSYATYNLNDLAPVDAGSTSKWEPQGSELLAAPLGLEPFSVATTGWVVGGTPATIAVVDGELTVDGQPSSSLAGATFTATAPDSTLVPMRITSVIWNDRESPVRYEYVVEYQGPGGNWHDLCPDEHPGAMLIPGSFAIDTSPTSSRVGSNGNYDPTAGLTFSCRDGAAAKCINWGYRPWANGEVVPYFEACTRMARADYCGTGHSRTVNGTMISFGDTGVPPITSFTPLPGFETEAVWGTGRGTQGQPAALCLSRTRWSTIPLGDRSPCAELLPHPGETESPLYCDDMTIEHWTREGALFLNTSRELDVGLHRWTDDAGHYATTTRFVWYGNDVRAVGPPGYPRFVSIEGSTYKPTPVPPPVPGLVRLFRYTKLAGDTLLALTTTSTDPGDGFGDRVLEAYVFEPTAEPPAPTAQPLFLYKLGNDSFVTTTEPTPPAGYTQATLIGWLPH